MLSDRRHYNVSRGHVQIGLATLLRTRDFVLTAKDACLHALEVWVAYPKLSFPDALGAAYSEVRGQELATFDRVLSRVPGVIAYDFGPRPAAP